MNGSLGIINNTQGSLWQKDYNRDRHKNEDEQIILYIVCIYGNYLYFVFHDNNPPKIVFKQSHISKSNKYHIQQFLFKK